MKCVLEALLPQNKQQLQDFMTSNTKFNFFLLCSMFCTPWIKNALIKEEQKSFNLMLIKHWFPIGSIYLTVMFQKSIKVYAMHHSSSGIKPVWLTCMMPNAVQQPVAYASRSLYIARSLQKAEQNYAQAEHKALRIVFMVKRFYQYLHGHGFISVTALKDIWLKRCRYWL